MGLLMSESLLIDPLSDGMLRPWDGLSAWAYTLDVEKHTYDEAADPTECPRLVFPSSALATDAGQ